MRSAKAGSRPETSTKSDVAPLVDAKRSSAVSDRLRATEDALKAAQAMIAEQEKREKELKRLLATGGRALDDDDRPAPPRRAPSSGSSTTDDQLQAMKTVHDNKIRALMKSIHQLQEQLQGLKTQDKEHRRSALIQNLRASQREQELMIDVLKQTLVDKVPEFQDSRDLVNDFIMKKSVGGPLRFRPPSREELENELSVLDGKYKRAVENLKRAKDVSESPPGHSRGEAKQTSARRRQQSDDDSDGQEGESAVDRAGRRRSLQQAPVEKEVFVVDPAQQEEIERLKVELASKNLTIHSQADELHELYAEIERLHALEEKIERKKDKIESLEERVSKLQVENVKLVHERETEAEKNVQLSEEIQFLRDSRVGDVQTSDSERLRQLELIQSLRARELELQGEMEDQQKKWSIDRTTIHQQMRLVEKEKELALEKLQRCEDDLSALQKKHDRLFVECDGLKEQLRDTLQQKNALHVQVQELEGTVALHESLSREEREAQVKTMTTRLRELEAMLEEKDELSKKLDRQLTAAKLLGRQGKKEKEQLQDRYAKLQEEVAVLRQPK